MMPKSKKQICYPSDENVEDGIIDDDDKIYDCLQLALGEIDRRRTACGIGYPFSTDYDVIKLTSTDTVSILSYKYLLFATRLNMKTCKIIDGVDGTLLFEELSAIAVKDYLGLHSESMVFGTSTEGGFRGKILDLISRIKEGKDYKTSYKSTNDEKDGGLDVVVWKSFADGEKGKFIGFGQCKTGTEWRNQVGALDPSDFCNTYFVDSPFCRPIKLFFVAESFRDNWEKICRRSGILFDRCRIMEHLGSLKNRDHIDLRSRMSTWVDGNMKYIIQSYRPDYQ